MVACVRYVLMTIIYVHVIVAAIQIESIEEAADC